MTPCSRPPSTCAGSPSPGAGSAPHTPSQWSSGSVSSSTRRSAAFRWPSKIRPTEPSAFDTARTRSHSWARVGGGVSAPAWSSATNAARGNVGLASSAAAPAAISSSTSRTATMVTRRALPEVGVAQRHRYRPGAFQRSRLQSVGPRSAGQRTDQRGRLARVGRGARRHRSRRGRARSHRVRARSRRACCQHGRRASRACRSSSPRSGDRARPRGRACSPRGVPTESATAPA